MSSSRISLAPGAHQRRVTSLLPGTNSAAAAASSRTLLRPHALLAKEAQAVQDGNSDGAAGGAQGVSLDYSALSNRIEAFKELFVAQLEQMTQTMQGDQSTHEHEIHDGQRSTETMRTHIERQRNEQRELYQTVASERQEESSAQAQLTQLQASRASLAQRLSDAEAERDKLQANLDKKRQSNGQKRQQLAVQMKRNRPELLRFNEKLGCRVSAGSDSTGKNRSVIKFTFNLLDPRDWNREAYFVIDASKSSYEVINHSPRLQDEELGLLVDGLNTSRALFLFIKKMRTALREQMLKDRQR